MHGQKDGNDDGYALGWKLSKRGCQRLTLTLLLLRDGEKTESEQATQKVNMAGEWQVSSEQGNGWERG